MPLPPFDRSAVDGYGIHRADLAALTTNSFRQVATTSPVQAKW
jgi:molybdopterin biosynthesis enzyme